MLGAEQRDWLQYGVSHSMAKWKIKGNQVVFSSYNYPKQMAKYEKSMDMWEGYPIERDQILSKWLKDEEKNIIILTGDVHASFSIDLRKDIHDPKTHVGTEWVAPSITSSSLDEYIPTWKARLAEKFMAKRKTNPQINYLNSEKSDVPISETFRLEICDVRESGGPSGTKVREAIANDDLVLFKEMTPKSVHKFYNELKKYITK
jgi:alkaline phosphatase D